MNEIMGEVEEELERMVDYFEGESNERLCIINQTMEELTDGETIVYLDVNPLFVNPS